MFYWTNPQNIEKHIYISGGALGAGGGGGTGTSWEAGPGRREERAAGRHENPVSTLNPDRATQQSTRLFLIQLDAG